MSGIIYRISDYTGEIGLFALYSVFKELFLTNCDQKAIKKLKWIVVHSLQCN